MPLYENSVIYKLVHCNDQSNENIYIGSTTNFRGRKNEHKSTCYNTKTRHYNQNVYQFIRDNGVWEEWLMIPIEVYPCNNRQELLIKERYYVESMKPKLNKQIPNRTPQEYYEDEKEHLSELSKKYREDNKERIKEHKKQYYDNNKEYIKEQVKKYIQVNKEHVKDYKKQYREKNIEHVKQKEKQYRENNKEYIKDQAKQYLKKVDCECGCKISLINLKRHQTSKKHIQIMETKEKEIKIIYKNDI